MSTEHQRYSIEGQTIANAAYAVTKGYEVIRTYRDAGLSGVTLKGRRGLSQLLADVLSGNAGIDVVLVYDVSRWGRFQDPDEAGHYEFLCRQAGVRIEYTTEAFANDDSMATTLVKHMKRAMAAEYSRELSDKVSRAKAGLGLQGYWCGGPCSYGYRRCLVAPDGELGRVMEAGERKALQGYRTTLVLGPEEEVATVRRIFKEFVVHGLSITSIVRRLNAEGVVATRGLSWSSSRVSRLLNDEQYAGTRILWRHPSQLKRVGRRRPTGRTRVPGAAPAIVTRGLFESARLNLRRFRDITDDMLLDQLRRLLAETGRLTQRLVNNDPDTCNATVFQRRFGGLVPAFELVGYKPSYQQVAMRAVRLLQPIPPWAGPRFPMTNEAIMDGLRQLLVRHGRLTAQLIDLDPDLPSTTTCRDRLGGLDLIYKALGYEPSAQQLGRFRASPRLPITVVDAAPIVRPGGAR
jgi:DNA invertase Pin-like site-specific DNA recombinase